MVGFASFFLYPTHLRPGPLPVHPSSSMGGGLPSATCKRSYCLTSAHEPSACIFNSLLLFFASPAEFCPLACLLYPCLSDLSVCVPPPIAQDIRAIRTDRNVIISINVVGSRVLGDARRCGVASPRQVAIARHFKPWSIIAKV